MASTQRGSVGWGILTGLLASSLAAAGEAGSPPRFVAPPSAARVGEGVRIAFSVDRPTDVEVAVLDEAGRVVRHLAAGMLGPNAPQPFQKGALGQTLLWDGRDDLGRAVETGACSIRVRIGLTPRWDGLIGYNPQVVEAVRGLAVDERGQLYVLNVIPNTHPNDGTAVCQVFDRQGTYLRTILPYPADLPEEELRGLRRLELADGRRVPFVHQGETRSFYPGVGELPRGRPVVTRDGRLAFVGIQEYGRYAQPGVNRVTVIHTDGSVPDKGVMATKLADRAASGASLALSPDQKWLYATGLFDGPTGPSLEKRKWHHVVYRFAWEDETPSAFLGRLYEGGSGPDRFEQPLSLATDPQGRLYVADWGNDRIAVFAADGRHLADVAVEKPSWVEVHPQSGAVYVLAGSPANQLIKLAGLADAEELARRELPNQINGSRRHLWPVMTLDASADPPVIWAGGPSHWCEFTLLRIEDLGGTFGEPVEVTRLGGGEPSVGWVSDLSLDRFRRRLYVRRKGLFDARTGAMLDVPLGELAGSGPIACFGSDGNFYVYEGYPDAYLRRYDADLKPLAFASGDDRIAGLGSPRLQGRGLAADAQGNIYVLCQKSEADRRPGDARDANVLKVFGPDGQLKHEALVDAQIRQISSVRVDADGNVYLAAGLRPAGALLPPGLDGPFSDLKAWRFGISPLEMNWYPLMYGSIVKFPPSGGLIREDAAGPEATFAYENRVRVEGAAWIHWGASNVPSWRTKTAPDDCLCVPVRFDVDPFGRVFFPDVLRFRVGVLDTAGNVIKYFGGYGNQDSAGPEGLVPQPEIAFAWPQIVSGDDAAVYVADQLNRRIVRVRWGHAAEASCAVPAEGKKTQ